MLNPYNPNPAGLPGNVRVSALAGPAGADALLRLPCATPAAMMGGGGDGGALGLATRRNRFGRLPTEAASKQVCTMASCLKTPL